MTRDLILAIDGGQTSTKAIIAQRNGTVIGTGHGPACDHIHGPGGEQTNHRAIHLAAQGALRQATDKSVDIVSVGMGMTSAAREHDAKRIFEEIARELCDPDAIWVDADYVSNLYGASAGEPGVVVIAGGGSIGYGVDARGNEAVTAGLGYLLGDEGSAWYLGLQAIIAAVKANDGRGQPTLLLPFVREHYGLESAREIIKIIYADGFTRDQVSGIAPDVVRIARDDTVARQIVARAGEKLANIVISTIRQIHQTDDAVDVYPTGGVFAAGPLLTEPFETCIAGSWPTATIREPRMPPVAGALIQAIRVLGNEVSPPMLRHIKETLPPL